MLQKYTTQNATSFKNRTAHNAVFHNLSKNCCLAACFPTVVIHCVHNFCTENIQLKKNTENGVEFSSSCYQFFLNRSPQHAVRHNLCKIVVHLYTFKKVVIYCLHNLCEKYRSAFSCQTVVNIVFCSTKITICFAV